MFLMDICSINLRLINYTFQCHQPLTQVHQFQILFFSGAKEAKMLVVLFMIGLIPVLASGTEQEKSSDIADKLKTHIDNRRTLFIESVNAAKKLNEYLSTNNLGSLEVRESKIGPPYPKVGNTQSNNVAPQSNWHTVYKDKNGNIVKKLSGRTKPEEKEAFKMWKGLEKKIGRRFLNRPG